jgi:hypothetical protein
MHLPVLVDKDLKEQDDQLYEYMKKLWLCIFFISIMNSSCFVLLEFLKALDDHLETGKEYGVVGYHYRVYVENKTDETIFVFNRDGVRMGSIRKNKTKSFNVVKNGYIYVVGKKSQKLYLSIMCRTNQETFIIRE